MRRRPTAAPISQFSLVLLEARGGSLDALGRLFESCRPWLLAVAARELYHDHKTKSSAADFVQDAFLEAQRDFERFQGNDKGEFLNWLRRILLHNLADQRRRFSTHTRDISLERPLSEVTDSVPLVANELAPEDRVEAEEQATQLQSAISNLPGPYRQVIRLRFEEGRSFAEIARLMRKPSEDAARKLWERAMRTLRNAISHDATTAP